MRTTSLLLILPLAACASAKITVGGDDTAAGAPQLTLGSSLIDFGSVPVGMGGSAQVLDLSCGSGEVTLGLMAAGLPIERISACDPYTGEAYRTRVGRACEGYSFADVANGALDGRTCSGVVCSYALHLCEPSWLPLVCHALASVSPSLVIVTPHKRPEIPPSLGWELTDDHRDVALRVRLRLYERIV